VRKEWRELMTSRSFFVMFALIGPLVAFGLLMVAPEGFDTVFIASFCVALVGVAVISLFVESHSGARSASETRSISITSAIQLVKDSRFRVLIIAGSVLGLATMSDAFVYLGLQHRLTLPASVFPLLFVVTALVYFILAVPAGQLADRIGRRRVFLGGYVLLLPVYLTLLLPDIGYLELFGCLILFGAYYAATDGVLMALASAILPQDLRTSGLALVTTAVNVARLLASVILGALWTWLSMETAVLIFSTAMVLAITIVGLAFMRPERRAGHEHATIS